MNLIKLYRTRLYEASMSGDASSVKVDYNGASIGNFAKYVENNDNIEDTKFTVISNSDGFVVDKGELTPAKDMSVKKGDKVKIISLSRKDLKFKSKRVYAEIDTGTSNFYIPLGALLKPTGKQVAELEVSSKKKAGVYIPFKPGHRQEGEIVKLFEKITDDNWQFEHDGTTYTIKKIGGPFSKFRGNPKTDVYIKFDKPFGPLNSDEYKISLKDENATYVENWTTIDRMLQIFKKNEIIKFLNSTLETINSGKMMARSNADGAAFFIMMHKSSTTVFDNFTKSQKYEILTGEEKFKSQPDGIANCFYYAKSPKTISDFINAVSDIKTDKKMYMQIRGANAKSDKVTALVKNTKTGYWEINPLWKKTLGMK